MSAAWGHDYRHTDKRLRLVMTLIMLLETDRRTDGHYLVHYLPVLWSIMMSTVVYYPGDNFGTVVDEDLTLYVRIWTDWLITVAHS